jgi:hypothetical protein
VCIEWRSVFERFYFILQLNNIIHFFIYIALLCLCANYETWLFNRPHLTHGLQCNIIRILLLYLFCYKTLIYLNTTDTLCALTMSCLLIHVVTTLVALYLHVTTGFNVDTENFVRHRGAPGSMFGFSVAEHRDRGTSWWVNDTYCPAVLFCFTYSAHQHRTAIEKTTVIQPRAKLSSFIINTPGAT